METKYEEIINALANVSGISIVEALSYANSNLPLSELANLVENRSQNTGSFRADIVIRLLELKCTACKTTGDVAKRIVECGKFITIESESLIPAISKSKGIDDAVLIIYNDQQEYVPTTKRVVYVSSDKPNCLVCL